MEIIAKKSSGLVFVYILSAIACAFGGVFLFFSIIGEERKVYEIGMLIALLFVFIFCVIEVIIITKPPYVIITYENGVLRFSDGLQCAPNELQQVHYRRHSARGLQYSTGTLKITVNGEDHTYRNISDVVEVQDRLIELMRSTGK